jgi:hypothetical protein
MITLDFKDIHNQIHNISELVDSYDDFQDIDRETYWNITIDKYEFEGYIQVNGKRVYTKGSYTNGFEKLDLVDFYAEDDDLEEYLENYTLEELQLKIA